jgi:hypothetical protein
MDKES